MTADLPLDPPKSGAGAVLADWLETLLVLGDEAEFPRITITRMLAGEPGDAKADAAAEDKDVERLARFAAKTDQLLLEVERRAEAAPRVYPFRVEDGVVVCESVPGSAAYVFMLWLSWLEAPFRRDDNVDISEEPWDSLARVALEMLVGPKGDSRLFAQRYAVDPPTDERRPTSFPEAIDWLRQHLTLALGKNRPTEKAEEPEEERRNTGQNGAPDTLPENGRQEEDDVDDDDDEEDLPLRTYSDGGVDVVAWHHFRDGRAGFPVLLAQCTVQAKWRPKTRDISTTLWRSWIDFPTRPQKVLVIPFAVPEGKAWWRDRNRLAGMILDRMRVSELLEECDDDWLIDLASERTEWLKKERENVAKDEEPAEPTEPKRPK